MTSFDGHSPRSKPASTPPSHDGGEPHAAPASPLHSHQQHQHRGQQKGRGHGAPPSTAQKSEAHEQSVPTDDAATAGADKLSEEASTKMAENAIKSSADRPLFGGMKKQAKVDELHFSDPFEYIGMGDTRSTSGYPNKTNKAEA